VRKVYFDRANKNELSASLEKELSYCRVLGQANRLVEGMGGLGCSSQPLQEVSANRPVGLIREDCVLVDCVQHRETFFRAVRFASRSCVSGSRAERGRYAKQLLVEQRDRAPLRPTAARTLRVHGLNCGLELKAARAAAFRGFGEMAFGLID
jgi:hypothetical protein